MYRPDCDYVDGRVEERNLGEYDHSRLQTELAFLFRSPTEWGVRVVVECRFRVAPRGFRVPDLSILHPVKR